MKIRGNEYSKHTHPKDRTIEKRYPKGFDYGLGEGVIRNKAPKFKKEDILFENCGCSWKVLRVNKKSYTVQHIADGDKLNWDIADCDFHCKKD